MSGNWWFNGWITHSCVRRYCTSFVQSQQEGHKKVKKFTRKSQEGHKNVALEGYKRVITWSQERHKRVTRAS